MLVFASEELAGRDPYPTGTSFVSESGPWTIDGEAEANFLHLALSWLINCYKIIHLVVQIKYPVFN